MADIASSDVTYSVDKRSAGQSGLAGLRIPVSISFGNASLTYPSGGVPLIAGSLGCPNHVFELLLSDASNSDGLMYKVDLANLKIRIYFPTQEAGSAGNRAGIELSGGSSVVAATTLKGEAVGY